MQNATIHIRNGSPCCVCGRPSPTTTVKHDHRLSIELTESAGVYAETRQFLSLPACPRCAPWLRLFEVSSSKRFFVLLCGILGLGCLVTILLYGGNILAAIVWSIALGVAVAPFVVAIVHTPLIWLVNQFYEPRLSKYIATYGEPD